MKIEYQTGYAVDKPVDFVVNSANGFLLLGKSGAGRIRESSEKLELSDFLKYRVLLILLPKYIRKWFLRVYKKHNWELSKAQLDCVSLLLNNKKKPFELGDTALGSYKINNKRIIHAVGMSYNIFGKTERIPATEETVRKCIGGVLENALKLKMKSIAIPVMCARKSYGLPPRKSLEVIESVLEGYSNSSIKKVIICFDNDETEKYLNITKE